MSYPPPRQEPTQSSARVGTSPWVILIALGLFGWWCASHNYTVGQTVGVGIVIGGMALVVLVFRLLLRLGDKQEPAVVVQQGSVQPDPGWYLDPQGSGRQRWWDGSKWGEHTQ